MLTAQKPLSEGVLDLTAPAHTYVYRAYDAAGNLLYVGVTDLLEKRMGEHRRSSPWYPKAATVEWETYATRDAALELEAALIQSLRPPYNTVHNRESRAERMERVLVMRSDFAPVDGMLV